MSLLEQSQQWYPTHVRVVVIRARGLRSKGKDGTNDAFVIMQLGKEKYSSSVAEKSREPQWREEAEFELPLLQQGAKERSTLYLIVTHRALVGLDKFLGQAVIDLGELYQHKTRNKVGWHKLHSKRGKKEKERGEIEVDIRFVRNNMTASMFDLSMKDKSRSTLGKLKDRFKGKKKDGFSDSMSAVVPSTGASADSHDEDVAPKKSKLKMLFPKSNLQRNTLSQSMSVLPTGPTSPADVSKKAFDEDLTEIGLQNSPEEESSSKTFHVPKIMTHKRTSSADTKQVNLTPSAMGKKEAPSFFGGLRPKSDPMSQSNLCINGSHVYNEEPNPIAHSKPRGDPKLTSNSQFYASLEDLSSKSTTPSAETSGGLLFGVQVPKSTTPSASQSFGSTDDLTTQRSDQLKERDVSLPRSPEREQSPGKITDTVNVVGGSTKSLNPFEDMAEEEEEKKVQPTPEVEAVTKKEEPKRGGILPLFSRKTEAVKASGTKDSQNPFDTAEVKKPPISLWGNRTAAVKPKLDVSPEAETKASSLSSPLLTEPCSPSFPAVSDPFSLAPAIGLKGSASSSLHLTYSPAAQPLHSSLNAKLDSVGSSSCADEFQLSPSPLPSACGSSPPSTSLDTQTSQFPTEFVVGRSEEAEVPYIQSSKTSAQCMFQELTGRSVGEDWPNSAVEQCDLSQSSPIEIIPEGRLENTEEVGGGGSEEEMEMPGSMASQGEVSVDPLPLINFDSMSVSEASQPLEPPNISPCSSLSSSDVQLVQGEKVLPTPAPRKLMAMNQVSDGLLQPSEEQLLEDLISFQWKDEHEEMAVGSAEGGETDPTLAVGNSVYDLLTGQGEGSCGGTLVAELEPSTILRAGSSEAITDPLVPMVEEMDVNMGSPSSLGTGGQLVFPGKLEVSTEEAFTKEEAEAGSQSPSLGPPTPPAVTLAWEVEEQSPFALKSDQNQIITDSSDLGSSQFVMMETNDSEAHLQELVNESQSDNEVTLSEFEGEPFDQSTDKGKGTALPDKNDSEKLSVKANFGNPELTADVIEPHTLDVGHGLHLNEGPFTDQELQSSASLAVASSSSAQLVESVDFVYGEAGASPTPLDSVGLLVPPLSPPALLQSACPVPDDPPPAGSSHEAESSGQKKLLQAKVLPTEMQPIPSQSNGSTVPSKHRPHPVKPMSAVETRFNARSPEENLKSKIKNMNVLVTKSAGHSLVVNENQTLKDYDPSDAAAAYSQLTHDELIQLVLKQNEVIAKKDGHLRDLESYIDNLLVRVMEETPNILKVA
ncbi:rab11 family-interacting protein 1-like isoform X2 [Hypanus sabinus]|nr:rab11 family-interacting protein 1-like isoform X2 [Hypanus sabinus]